MAPQESDITGKIMDGNNDVSSIGDPTTPVVARQTATPVMVGSPLLREWSYTEPTTPTIPIAVPVLISPGGEASPTRDASSEIGSNGTRTANCNQYAVARLVTSVMGNFSPFPTTAVESTSTRDIRPGTDDSAVSTVPPESSIAVRPDANIVDSQGGGTLAAELEMIGQELVVVDGQIIQRPVQGDYIADDDDDSRSMEEIPRDIRSNRKKSTFQRFRRFFLRRKRKESPQSNAALNRHDTSNSQSVDSTTVSNNFGNEQGDVYSLREAHSNCVSDDCHEFDDNGSLIEAPYSRLHSLAMSTDRSEDSLVSAPAKSTASGSCGNTGAATGNKGKSQKKKGKSFLPALLGNKKNPPHSSRGSASARNSTRKQQKANSSSLSDRKPAARETQNAGQDTPRSTLSNTSVEPFSNSPSGDILSKIVAQSAHEARASLVGDSDPNCSEVCAHVTHIEELYTKQEDKGAKGSVKAAKGLNSSTDDMILGRLVEERMEQEECTQYKIHHSAKATIAKAKSDVGSIALSQAKPEDKEVYNDIVKLFVVGDNSANRSKLGAKLVYETLKIDGELPKDTGRKSRPTLRVDVNTWKPENTELNFTMWDVQSSKSKAGEEHLPNFGAHPDVQSLFFSDQALYLLVYDMAENDAENDASAYEAAQALEADIRKRVLSWIDCIARRTNRSVILPVAVVPSSMSSDEATSRCKITKDLLLRYTEELPEGIRPDILFCENDTLARVSLCEPEGNNSGLDDLAQLVVRKGVSAIPLVGRSVPPGTVEIWNELKARTATVMKVDDFIGELSRERKDSKQAVTEVLSFLASIGEVLYFNCSESDVKNYVINLTDSNSDENDTSHNKSAKLSMNKDDKLRVFVRGLCVFLQKRFESNLSKARSFVRGQYACQEMQFPYPESFISQTFTQEASSTCPLLSSSDMALLWHASLFDEEVEIFFPFLKVLLAHFGIFLPLGINETDETYFIPCLLPQPSTGDFWTYNCETPNVCDTVVDCIEVMVSLLRKNST